MLLLRRQHLIFAAIALPAAQAFAPPLVQLQRAPHTVLSESSTDVDKEVVTIESYLKTNYPLFESTLISNIPNI